MLVLLMPLSLEASCCERDEGRCCSAMKKQKQQPVRGQGANYSQHGFVRRRQTGEIAIRTNHVEARLHHVSFSMDRMILRDQGFSAYDDMQMKSPPAILLRTAFAC